MRILSRLILGFKIKNKLSLCNGTVLVQRYKSERMKYLNVAEKNDAAKNIALHLSRGTSIRREGLSQYNKIYEFEADVMGQKCTMVMTSVSGHLLALEFASSYKNWQSCNPLTLFDAPVLKYCPENYEKIKKTLEREVRSCQGLIIWTDCDREGENIGFEIIEVCSAIKSNLKIYRAKFSEITAVSVRRALQNLEQPNKNISNAVDVRQELDLRIGLSGNEQRLYEFIVRSFLACCSKDAQGQETCVAIEVAKETFSASGLMITARNYLEVYPYDKWSSKEIHVYENGQTFNPTSIDMIDGSTSPPNLLTEADLIALMEKHGIGTDATHAEHIETIKNRSYVALADAIHFVPGLLGMGLVEGYDAMGLNISKPHLRAQLEADLKAISEGRKQPEVVLAEQIAKYKEAYITVTAEANKIDNALAERFSERPNEYVPTTETLPVDMPTVLKCPKCGTGMVIRQKKNNPELLFISCQSYPNCKNAVWLPSIVKSLQVLPETCPRCGPNYSKVKFEWRNNSISHLYPPPYIGCIGGCDPTFLEFLQINPSSVKASTNTNQNIPNNVRTNSDNRSNNLRPNANNIRPSIQRNTSIGNMPSRPNNTGNAQPKQFTPTTNSVRVQNTAAPTRIPAPRIVGDSEDNNVICGCNKPAIQLTVRKQNANFGKKFYKCPVGKESGGCDFFLWAPESEGIVQNPYETPPESTSSRGFGLSPSNSAGGTTRGWGIAPSFPREDYQQNEDNVMCNCGLPCKRITVHKEGPNKGRPFYGCPKDFNSRCNFFQWADSGSTVEWSSSNATRGRGRGRGSGSGNSDAGGPRTRKCGLCRQEGHTRSRCPNNVS